MNKLKVLAAGAAIAISGSAASAATLSYADSVVDFTQGTCSPGDPNPVNANGCRSDRTDPTAALGAPDGDFVSLGFYGSLEVGFADAPFLGGTASIYELTFNRAAGHDEALDVYSVLGGVATFVATVFNNVDPNPVTIAGAFETIILKDVTLDYFASTSSFDGFDVDSIGVAAVPLPAGGLLLLAGLGGLAAMRRKS